MKHFEACFFVGLIVFAAMLLAKSGESETKPVRVALVKMPYVGERNVPDTSRGPDYLDEGGIRNLLEQQGVQVKPTDSVNHGRRESLRRVEPPGAGCGGYGEDRRRRPARRILAYRFSREL